MELSQFSPIMEIESFKPKLDIVLNRRKNL
jgi:hypothetical protein